MTSAMRLNVGNVILGSDDRHHTVTRVEHHPVGAGMVTIETDTGTSLTLSGIERYGDTFVVVLSVRVEEES